jgi:hypothetical protein
MQPVAPVVEAVAGVFEAPRVAADGIAALEEHDLGLLLAREAPRRADTRGPASEDRDVRHEAFFRARAAHQANVAAE